MGKAPPDRAAWVEGMVAVTSRGYAGGIRLEVFLDARVLSRRGGASDIVAAVYDHLIALGCSAGKWSPTQERPGSE